MEVLDIGLNEFEPPMSIRFSDDAPSSPHSSSNFGMGIEMLMNDKHRSSGSSSKIDMGLGELDRLENELNDLRDTGSENGGSNNGTKVLSGFSNLFGFGSEASESRSDPVKFSFEEENDSRIGHATATSVGGNTRTWDGYQKVNEVPLTDSNGYVPVNDRERRRKKRAMLKKLDDWSEKGFLKNSSHFNMESTYEDIEDEFEAALSDKRKSDAVKLQGWWFMSVVNSIEYANTQLNPFDLNLDGWAEKVGEDLDDYEDIFSELHDKYSGVKLSPEISIILRLGFSAAVVNFTNKSFSTATPGFSDVMKQNPGMMKQFSSAVVNSMANQNPLFAMANNMLNKEPEANTTFGPPPAPINTQTPTNIQAHSAVRPGMTYTQNPGNRPDIAASRGIMFRENGIDLTEQNNIQQQEQQRQQQFYQQQQQDQQRLYHEQQRQQQQQHQTTYEQQQQNAYEQQLQQRQETSQRPEMKGPQHNVDINNILAGLKTREPELNTESGSYSVNDADSMISVNSIRDINNTSMPKRANSRRKSKSDKNVISLDI